MILRNIMPNQRLRFVASRLQLADAQFSKELYEVELEEVILLLQTRTIYPYRRFKEIIYEKVCSS